MVIEIDKGVLLPEDYENTKLITLDDGSQEEVYISRAGNIVTNPKDRVWKDRDDNKQQVCWDLYIKSLRDGRPSATQAAKDAGYLPNSAMNIRKMKWFKDKMKTLSRSRMVSNAERNLARGLNTQWSKMKLLENGEQEEVIDVNIFAKVMDVSKYVTSTLAKDEGYSTKTEVSGKMDGEIKINSISYADQPLEIENKIIDNQIKQIENVVLEEVNKQEL